MDSSTEAQAGKAWRRVAIGLIVAFGIYMIGSYVALPIIAKRLILSTLTEERGLSATIDRVRFDPWKTRLTIQGFELPDPDPSSYPDPDGTAQLLRFEELAIDLRPLGFLAADLALDELVLVGPRVWARVGEDGELGLAKLWTSPAADASDAADPPDEKDGESPLIDIGTIRVEAGVVVLRDESRDEPFELTIAPMALEVHDLFTRLGQTASFDLMLEVGEGTELRWTGGLEFEPLRSSGQLKVSGFDLRLPWQYFSSQFSFEVRNGRLAASAQYEANLDAELSLSVSEGLVEVTELSILDRRAAIAAEGESVGDSGVVESEDVLAVSSLSFRNIRALVENDTLASLGVEQASAEGGRLVVALEEDSEVSLAKIFAPRAGAAGEQEPAPNDEGASNATPPRIQIGAVSVRDLALDFVDRTTPRPVRLELKELTFNAAGYDSEPGSEVTIELDTRVDGAGQLHLAGPVQVDPVTARLEVAASDISLQSFLPYTESQARIDLLSGRLSADLSLAIEAAAGSESEISGRGRLQIDDLRVVEIGTARDLLRWKALRLEGLELSPNQLRLAEVALEQAFAEVAIHADGRSNLESVLVSNPAPQPAVAEAESESARTPSIRVDLVRLDSANIAFSDAGVDPAYRTTLGQLSGTIKGLDSSSSGRAEVDLHGNLDESAPLEIKGQIDPFHDLGSNDVSLTLSGVSMPSLAAYSGRYVGYGIDRGKLDIQLDYHLEGRHLQAENRFRLNRFEFGERVEHPEATSLPVPLALTLMRGTDGAIEIDLPIEGNLDDPSFSLLGLVGKAFVNLITRVATTPFAVVGSVIGFSAEDLSHVVFAGGSDRLSDSERVEMDELARVLIEKSSLQIEIRGRADPAEDQLGGDSERALEAGRELARARAASIRDAILAHDGIEADRLFLMEVEVGAFASDGGSGRNFRSWHADRSKRRTWSLCVGYAAANGSGGLRLHHWFRSNKTPSTEAYRSVLTRSSMILHVLVECDGYCSPGIQGCGSADHERHRSG